MERIINSPILWLKKLLAHITDSFVGLKKERLNPDKSTPKRLVNRTFEKGSVVEEENDPNDTKKGKDSGVEAAKEFVKLRGLHSKTLYDRVLDHLKEHGGRKRFIPIKLIAFALEEDEGTLTHYLQYFAERDNMINPERKPIIELDNNEEPSQVKLAKRSAR